MDAKPSQEASSFPGITAFLQRLGISSQDSDFEQLRSQFRDALECGMAFDSKPPSHWEDKIIEEHVEPGAHVLDLGCGDGELLARLVFKRHASVQGVERNEERVLRCIERGIPVYHEDIEKALKNLSDGAFELAILENTLQTLVRPIDTLHEMLRVANVCAISFPNFAHWSVRLAFSIGGKMPVTSALPYTWYNTPNIHFCSITDFLDWTKNEQVQILDAYALENGEVVPFDLDKRHHNITAEHAIFFVRKSE